MEAPQMPKIKMFLISGNNTGTGILQNIMDANGTGLICETEADTISAAIGSEYGHWSDTLRKAFDHDRLSYNRRTDQEYREVKKSYLSVPRQKTDFSRASCFIICTVYGHGSTSLKVAKTIWKPSSQA